MDAFVAVSFRTRDQIDQAGEGALIVQERICLLVFLCMGNQEGGGHQDHVWFVILFAPQSVPVCSATLDHHTSIKQ